MHVTRLIVENYRALKSVDIEFHRGTNIIVGDNDTGKSTLLEALNLGLTGKLRGRSIAQQLHPLLFNHELASKYVSSVVLGAGVPPLETLIEVYLAEDDDVAHLRGTNNSQYSDECGVVLKIALDPECADEYRDYILKEGHVLAIPIEYYNVEWMSFAGNRMLSRRMPVKVQLIDATTYSLNRQSSRYLLEFIQDHLRPEERVDLSLAYRKMQRGFIEEKGVERVNDLLSSRKGEFTSKELSIAHDSVNDRSWEDGVVPHLDEIPMSLVGKGEQSSTKIWLAMHSASKCSVFLIEEPENHLSHSTLNGLLDRLSEKAEGKQLFLSTHSSFVVNKLGVNEVILFNRGVSARLSDLSEDTDRYFRKLPGHDTLRLILSKHAILVEGPSDELIVQRAYLDLHGKLPLKNGIDIITVRSLAFKRFLEIAKLLKKEAVVVTDNDGDVEALHRKYADWFEVEGIKICFSEDEKRKTLEPQLFESNGLEKLNQVFGKTFGTEEKLLKWMEANKTDAALAIFEAEEVLQFPDYILEAING